MSNSSLQVSIFIYLYLRVLADYCRFSRTLSFLPPVKQSSQKEQNLTLNFIKDRNVYLYYTAKVLVFVAGDKKTFIRRSQRLWFSVSTQCPWVT